MTHYKTKKMMKLAGCIIVLIIAVIIWAVNYIDVNRRFPKAVEEIYHVGDDIKYNDFTINVNDISYVSADEAKDKYDIDGKDDFEYFIVSMNVTNESDKTCNLEKSIGQYVGLEAYPIGYNNQGTILVDSKEDSNIEPNESKRMIIYFIITNGMVRKDRRGMLKRSDIYLDFSNYPIHRAVLFEDVKGF